MSHHLGLDDDLLVEEKEVDPLGCAADGRSPLLWADVLEVHVAESAEQLLDVVLVGHIQRVPRKPSLRSFFAIVPSDAQLLGDDMEAVDEKVERFNRLANCRGRRANRGTSSRRLLRESQVDCSVF